MERLAQQRPTKQQQRLVLALVALVALVELVVSAAWGAWACPQVQLCPKLEWGSELV